ncbi:MAG: hypothetical protein J0L64_19645 [Acidobacteria bacterium]|nr:hypothetical protein [Acidobacteriota bacterium]
MMQRLSRGLWTAGLLAALAVRGMAQEPSVTVYGALSNFDVVNDTGHDVHGFEIEFHGVSGVNSYYNWNRYGPPQVVPMQGGGGVHVRWMSSYDANSGRFVTGTPQAVRPTAMTGHQCVIGTAGYDVSGCEHFGLTTVGNPTSIVYRWMVADPSAPGKLMTYGSRVAIPAPLWSVQPPARPGQPVNVVADIDPPIPPAPAKLFGEAQWMKTYKMENNRHVLLDELVADNPVVPQNAPQLETQWDLIQAELGSNSKRKQKRGGLGNGAKAVVRRFEFYKYTGPLNPVTGEAMCADVLCNAPGEGELGDFIGAQNAAANLNIPAQLPVTVTVSGDGQVSSSDGSIRCPGACSLSVLPHTTVMLTAKAGKGVFSGWTGACVGSGATCTLVVDSAAPLTAVFVPAAKLNLTVNGLGSVTKPSGTSFAQGSSIDLLAAPAAGNSFLGWSGACSGNELVCSVTMNGDTAVTANFTGGVVAPPPAPATFKLVAKTNGKGTVAVSPAGSSFPRGTVVTLTATPSAGSPWVGWTGACSGTARTCTVTVNGDTAVTANFR